MAIVVDISGWMWYSGTISRLYCTEVGHNAT
jgi:hypothetical protein